MPRKRDADKNESNERSCRECGIGSRGHIRVQVRTDTTRFLGPKGKRKKQRMNSSFGWGGVFIGRVALCSGVLVNYLEVALFCVAVVLNAQNGWVLVLVHHLIKKERREGFPRYSRSWEHGEQGKLNTAQWHPGKFDGDRNTKPKLGDRTGDRTFTLFSIM